MKATPSFIATIGAAIVLAALTACVPLPPPQVGIDPVPPVVTTPPVSPAPSVDPTTAPQPTGTVPTTPGELGDWPTDPLVTLMTPTPAQFSSQIYGSTWNIEVVGAATYAADGEGTPAPAGQEFAVLTMNMEATGEDASFRVDFDVVVVDDTTGQTYAFEPFQAEYVAVNPPSALDTGRVEGVEILVTVPAGTPVSHWMITEAWDANTKFDITLTAESGSAQRPPLEPAPNVPQG